MNKTKKIALYATIPILGLATLAGSAFAASAGSDKSKGKMGRGMGGPEIVNEDKMLDSVVSLTLAQVKAQLAAGKTIDAIIAENAIDKTTIKKQVKATIEADMQTKLDADIKSGKITQAQVDKMKTKMAEEKTKHTEALAKALGMTTADVTTALDGGKTIDQLITEKGLNKETVMKSLKPDMKGFSKKIKVPVPVTN